MKLAFLSLLFFFVVRVVSGQTTDDESNHELLEDFHVEFPREKIMELLSNHDVHWSGEYIGCVPYLSPNAEAILSILRKKKDEKVIERLQNWLADPERFVVAHVLLTFSREEFWETSANTWNKLQVTRNANGKYDTRQMESLRKMWNSHENTSGLDP